MTMYNDVVAFNRYTRFVGEQFGRCLLWRSVQRLHVQHMYFWLAFSLFTCDLLLRCVQHFLDLVLQIFSQKVCMRV